MASSHFIFTLPAAATPSFRTPMVSLRWALHFELLVGPPPAEHVTAAVGATGSLGRGGGGTGSRVAPPLQRLLWSLPLVVLPPSASANQAF